MRTSAETLRRLILRGSSLLFLLWLGTAAAAEGKAKAPKESSDGLFTNTAIRHLRIEITPADMAVLRKYNRRAQAGQPEREDVHVTVREGGLTWTNVGLHLKGGAGSYRSVDNRPALTLNFDKFADGQRFHGLQKISLNNSVQDTTCLSEKLCREIYNAAGVPVPRADYATVELNGRSLGLYVLVEGWNKQFLKRHFPNVKGNLYDGSYGKDIDKPLPVNTGDEAAEQAELKALHAVCTNKDLTMRWKQLNELLDLDRFLTLQALDVMMWNWDGYAMNRNNYRLFHDRASDRLVFMPHGLDQMFWTPEGPLVTGTKGIVARAVMKTPEGRRRYLEKVAQLRATVFNVEQMTRRVNELSERIRPAVAQGGLGAAVQHSAWVKILRDRIAQRAASIDAQLVGAQKMLAREAGAAVPLAGWASEAERGKPVFEKSGEKPVLLQISAKHGPVAAAWFTTNVWLEEGTYRVSGRIKTRAVVVEPEILRAGAGLRVWSGRKLNEGISWDWFPYRESQDVRSRGELPPIEPSRKLAGTSDWQEVTYDFELRQPMADLAIFCELRAASGEAWFDPASIRITQTKPDVSTAGLPKTVAR